MDVQAQIARLRREFRRCSIISLPADNPTEIICELRRYSPNFDQSEAIAVIEESQPHVHNKTTETYRVEEGTLDLQLGTERLILMPKSMVIILPGVMHWARGVGGPVRVRVVTAPAWTPEDHILMK